MALGPFLLAAAATLALGIPLLFWVCQQVGARPWKDLRDSPDARPVGGRDAV
jgi:hypothetical protein